MLSGALCFHLATAARGRRCGHSVTDREKREFAGLDRATGPPEVIDYYGFKALTTWGDERDFRWFMPRLFELLVSYPAG